MNSEQLYYFTIGLNFQGEPGMKLTE